MKNWMFKNTLLVVALVLLAVAFVFFVGLLLKVIPDTQQTFAIAIILIFGAVLSFICWVYQKFNK